MAYRSVSKKGVTYRAALCAPDPAHATRTEVATGKSPFSTVSSVILNGKPDGSQIR
jgi:hypothetical protein